MTNVPVAAYFENFLGPWKPVKASDGEYYTLVSGRLPWKLTRHLLSSPHSSLQWTHAIWVPTMCSALCEVLRGIPHCPRLTRELDLGLETLRITLAVLSCWHPSYKQWATWPQVSVSSCLMGKLDEMISPTSSSLCPSVATGKTFSSWPGSQGQKSLEGPWLPGDGFPALPAESDSVSLGWGLEDCSFDKDS